MGKAAALFALLILLFLASGCFLAKDKEPPSDNLTNETGERAEVQQPLSRGSTTQDSGKEGGGGGAGETAGQQGGSGAGGGSRGGEETQVPKGEFAINSIDCIKNRTITKVKGQIENKGSTAATNVRIRVDLFSQDSLVKSAYIEVASIEQNSTKDFEGSFEAPEWDRCIGSLA